MTVASPCPTSTKTTVVAPEEAPEAPLPAPPDAVEPVGVADGVGWGVFGVLAGDGSAVGCADGACVAAQPYVDEAWLVHYLLRFGGEALPLDPVVAVERLRTATEALLVRYTSRL